MDLTSASLSVALEARARATGSGVTSNTTTGRRITKDFAADLAYSFLVTAAAAGNVATLTQSTGVVAQTTGVPVISDGDGKDWEGVTLPLGTASLIEAVLIEADSDNTGNVTVAAADGLEGPSGILKPGGFLLLAQPTAGAVGSGSTLALTIADQDDQVRVWVFAKSA